MLHLTFEKQKKTNNNEEIDKEISNVFVPRNQNVCLSKVIDREGTVESQRNHKGTSEFTHPTSSFLAMPEQVFGITGHHFLIIFSDSH